MSLSTFPSPPEFAELLLEEQFALLDLHLSAESLPGLLSLCESLPDTGPLLHLVTRSLERGYPWPAERLLTLRSLALQAVLELPGLERAAEQAWLNASLSELVAFCLLDRYLRRRLPERWEALSRLALRQAEESLEQAADAGTELLLRLPGSAYRSLARRFPEAWQRWPWRTAARAALQQLAERPRDVSQANAERLLSSQVYTDPGHFLLELLQNADDAGASWFAVDFEPARITVRHNGAPFDFRDLVGLLSIGQSTKKATQIGYFGVGFKSIYEVTRRPRLRSGHFCFEIADISVPRTVSEFGREDETTLVLPLKPGVELEPLWQRALSIEPALLLQLPHLRSLQWRRAEECIELSLAAESGDVWRLSQGQQSRRFRLWSDRYTHAGPRPVGKPGSAALQVALPLDDAPLGATLYSFLPVAEDSGLRFLVGSHFDVPVDRERLDPGSEWNRGLLQFLPQLLSRHLAAEPSTAWEILPLLPLPADPLPPLFAHLPGMLSDLLRDLPLVPGGRLASEVEVVEPELAELFPEELPLGPRQRAWLVELGAQVVSVDTVLTGLEAGHCPGRLQELQPADWSRLHRLLGNQPGERLRALPLLLDAQRQPVRAEEVVILEAEWQGLFTLPPRHVHPELVTDPDSAALLAKLGVTRFGWKQLSARLHRSLEQGMVLDRLYDALLDAPPATVVALLELPLFPAEQGGLAPIATPATYRQGLVAADASLPRQLFPNMRFLAAQTHLEMLLEGLGWPRLQLPGALDTLMEHIHPAQAERALEFLAGQASQLSRAQLHRLFSLPLFVGRPLGQSGVQVARPEFIEAFGALQVAVLDQEWTRRLQPLLEAAGIRPLGMPELIEHLLAQRPRPESLAAVWQALLGSAEELENTVSRERRQALPLWLGRDGKVRAAEEVPPSDELAEWLGRLPARPLQEPECELIPWLSPAEFLERLLRQEARLGRPLREQPAWLNRLEQVDRLAELLRRPLQVDVQGRLRDTSLYQAPALAYPLLLRSHFGQELLHPDSSQKGTLLPPSFVLETFLSLRDDAELRRAFYAYVEGELSSIVAEPEGRRLLTELPLWRSAGEGWKQLRDLIVDPQLELQGDWTPHPEVPPALLERLQSTLGVGRPEAAQMLRQHLLPAYLRGRNREALLSAMARLASSLEGHEVRRLLRPPDGNGPFPLPGGGELCEAYCPPGELAPLPSLPPVRHEFLRRLGLPPLPGPQALRKLRWTRADGTALLALVEWAWENQPEALEPLWETLGEVAWLPNRQGLLKLPRQLFGRTAELRELVGDSPELFVAARLPAALARRLGVKEERDLDGALVLRHLTLQVKGGQRVSSRVYRFLERGLSEGRIASAYLKETLKGLAWIWTDEGDYRRPQEVLGTPAFRYFGSFRGTWEGVHERYPSLAQLFDIPGQVTAAGVLQFLQEVHGRPPAEPEVLLRLLRSCLTFLGEQEEATFPRDWRVIPARVAGERTPVLVSAATPGLVRSNSPTLEALFARAGRLYVAESGEPSLDKLYDRLGIPRLREAYSVRPDGSGRDVTEQQGERLAAFRRLLRALQAVVPRLRLARPELEEGEWLDELRLGHFGSFGPVRVLEDLALAYELPGLQPVRVEAAAAYHPERQQLLVSAAALRQPERHAVALAEGLLECIYQGPGSEGLVDLLNLLIPLLEREAMDAYLDRRHFPRLHANEESEEARLRNRVGEFLDFGLQRVLEQRFPELAGSDWSRWRRPGSSSAEGLLAQLGVAAPSPELLEEVRSMLAAEQLETWSRALALKWRRPEEEREESESPAVAARVLSPEPAPKASPVAPAEPSLAGRVLQKLGQWLGGSGAPGALHHNREALGDTAESYRHPPERHLLVSTRALQGGDLYCLNQVGVHFDFRHQLYLPGALPWPDTYLPSGRTVDFSGYLTLPQGNVPKPLRSRFSRNPRGPLQGPDAFGEFRCPTEGELSYSVELSQPLNFRVEAARIPVDPQLLRATAPDAALPRLVHEWIDWARGARLQPWQLAERARDFVISHYLYDLKFLEDVSIRAYAQQPALPGENRSLNLLHRGASGRYLGRGVCFELSTLLLEMLRRAGIPAVLASVWMLDCGLIHQPDHAVVLAYLASDRGPAWIPFDPSHNRMESHRPAEASRSELLQAAVDLVLGPSATFAAPGIERERQQERALLERLGSQRRLEILLEFLSSSRYVRELDSDLRCLIDAGWLQMGQEQLYRVWAGGN